MTVRDTALPPVGDAPIETAAQKAKRKQQWVLVSVVCFLFIILNGVVVWLIDKQLDVENAAIVAKALQPSDRTVTSGVFMSLIGATVVQTGYAIRTVMKYLFPGGEVEP